MKPLPLALLLLAAPALAGEPPPGATPLQLTVGERLDICAAKLVPACPVSRFLCDDPGVATVELAAEGKPAAVIGVGPGKTVCAVYGYSGAGRRILAITVAKPAPK